MKRKVIFSTYCMVMTILALIILICIMVLELRIGNIFLSCLAGAALLTICVLAMFYSPLTISVEDGCVNVNTLIRVKSIPLKDIQSVMVCPPTMAERRICGSGGWFGYWGWFREASIGKYFAYYGKASDCFLIRLRDGRLYMLGCADPLSMSEYISNHLEK